LLLKQKHNQPFGMGLCFASLNEKMLVDVAENVF